MLQQRDYFLMIMSGPDDGRAYDLAKEQVAIGAALDNDIPVRDDRYVRPFHVLLIKRDGKYFLVSESPSDKNSQITVPISVGQIFTLGETEFVIRPK
jgi:hypothetical protein